MRVMLELRPGEGGEDAYRFAQDLAQAYTKMAQRYG